MMWLEPIGIAIMGYLLGSIPFGLLLTRLVGLGDIRSIGSGNIGATNVLRTGNKGIAALTLVLDALKGAAAVLIAREWAGGMEMLAAIGAFLGHLYPIWLKFAGGKGVATLLGIVTALDWHYGAAFALVWIVTVLFSRYSSLGGILASISTIGVAAWLGEYKLLPMFIGLALLVVWKHRENIERIANGTESRVGKKA